VRIALLEDEPAQAELIQMCLKSANHDSHHFTTGKSFLQSVTNDTYDMLIMDWNVPDTNGPEVLKQIRERLDWEIPVLFVTSRVSEDDIVYALEQGADDYMTKPVKQKEVIARINALERRSKAKTEKETLLELPPYTINISNRELRKYDKAIELTQKEFDVALLLFRNRGRLLSRKYLLQRVWGQTADLNTRTVDTHISKIRTKLGINPAEGWRLSSVYQHGYRLEQNEQLQ
jgi:DNA-binding response OmpR family regulator